MLIFFGIALTMINLASNKISRIDNQAFSILDPSRNDLVIDLSNNLLNVNSFERYSLDSIRRDAYLKINGNKQITFLREQTFFDFLLDSDTNNFLEMNGVNLKCIRQNNWILHYKGTLMDKIIGLKEIWDKEPDECEDN